MEKYFEISEDNISIKCKMYYKDLSTINKVLVSCHGFGGSKENNASKKLSEYILDRHKDVCILTFDWPCHGKDVRQKLTLDDCSNYFNHVINYAKKRFNADVYLNATSFGGYLSLKYIHEYGCPFKKMVLRCPAVIMYQVLNENILTEDNKKLLSHGKSFLFGYDRQFRITKEFVDSLKENDITKYDYSSFKDKLLIFHGTDDELVPFDKVKEFAHNNSIDFIGVEGADHRFQNPAKMHEFVLLAVEFLFN